MSNPFQEQLLKAGLVSKQQVKKANQEKLSAQHKQQRNHKQAAADAEAARAKARQAADAKAQRDRVLNQQKQQQAHKKAISVEIDQLISSNSIKRDQGCDIAYNFAHRNKVNRIYINAEMKQQIMQGRIGIARIQGHYELVPMAIAEKIQQRNDKRIVLFDKEQPEAVEDDAYADYQIPDDLMW